MSSQPGPQLTSLLTNAELARLERLRLNPAQGFTNRVRGEHLIGKGGSSTDFSDYRDYAPGDDVRFVDWNIFSRLHRPYMKLYEQEEEKHVVVLLDASSSMRFEGKFERARQLAAAFGVMALMGGERLTVSVFNAHEATPSRLGPCAGRRARARLFSFLEALACGGDAPLEEGLDETLKQHSGRGVAVVLSDFHTTADLRRLFNRLYSSGLETFAVQILGPAELDPELAGDARLVDAETGRTLDVTSANDLLEIYHDYREARERDLATLCRQRGGRFAAASSEESLGRILFERLLRGGWVR